MIKLCNTIFALALFLRIHIHLSKKKRKEIKSVSCLDIYYITSLVSIEDSEDEDYGNLSNDETSGKIGRIINPRCPF